MRSNASAEMALHLHGVGLRVSRWQSCMRNSPRHPVPDDFFQASDGLSRFRNPSNRIHQTPQNRNVIEITARLPQRLRAPNP